MYRFLLPKKWWGTDWVNLHQQERSEDTEKLSQENYRKHKKIMEIKAEANHIRVSTKKMELLIRMIKDSSPSVVLEKISLLNKSGVEELAKLIKSAISSAVNNFKLAEDKLKIKELSVRPAGLMKRFRAASRGVGHSYKKRMSHIKIILEG